MQREVLNADAGRCLQLGIPSKIQHLHFEIVHTKVVRVVVNSCRVIQHQQCYSQQIPRLVIPGARIAGRLAMHEVARDAPKRCSEGS
jgi:hypothetical protein